MFFSCILGYGSYALACAICDELLYRFAMPDLVRDIEKIDGQYVAKRGEAEASSPSPMGTEKEGTGKNCSGLRIIIQLVRHLKHKFRIHQFCYDFS